MKARSGDVCCNVPVRASPLEQSSDRYFNLGECQESDRTLCSFFLRLRSKILRDRAIAIRLTLAFVN
ncbi:hypothetical protein CKA32_000454 [Geitlerinema sp. FC II]|nr:hypothetical protein CKA32_000454 [Geitlerinema sp. FC II]